MDFETTAAAFQAARTRASVAASLEDHALHLAIAAAHAAGMTVREAAAALRAPRATVGRHWREGHRCTKVLPVWGDANELDAAERAIWAHAPEQLEPNRLIASPLDWFDAINAGLVDVRR